MSDRRLILKDGTVMEEGECGYSRNHLWCWVKGITMAEAFAIFSNPDKTSEIRFQYGSTEDTYTGFTELTAVQKGEFTTDVCLVRHTTEGN